MVDNKVPIIYLSGEELNSFSIQEDTTVFGHSYEWEGERVVHLCIHPVLHSYGAHGKSIFSKIDTNHMKALALFNWWKLHIISKYMC